MNIGIIIALPEELVTLTSQHLKQFESIQIDNNIQVILSGIGAENASIAAEKLYQSGVNSLISWGCAAALEPSLKPGDILFVSVVVILVSVLAALQPAFKAARMEPVDALRHV